ncbi:hypothetical protein KBY66_03330 [Synechococcus sp. Tobar12-5m-g]|uniref:hypothetical protein n=1 Tax=unclassified Synechococcus TaxID=2626047 RepID=UPI0020CC383F|nr:MULTISPECIES: hypothetical protein [unclassified Synechococcus]MCP9771660.1 hypothetical protein [Synechococcus sp. Tobar12-5m-g]MCP9872601.1 hypothetical protein [Synechococcus sp. Cruz CV-v-12]
MLIDGQEWFLRMQQFHSDGRDWISLPPRPEEITRVNPLEAFPLDAPAEKLLRCCRVVALLQAAAGGNPVEIWQVLKIAGLEEAADFVAKHANGKITWDELLVPSAFPSPRKFLVAAFAGPRHEWHHWVLENLCEGGEDWDQGENPVQVPLPAGSAIKADEGAAEAAAETIKPC